MQNIFITFYNILFLVLEIIYNSNCIYRNVSINTPSSMTKFKYSTFWKRFLGFIIDHVLCTILTVTISNQLEITDGKDYWIYVLTYFIYNTLMDSSRLQGTIGKLVLKMKVVDMAGNRLTLTSSLYRNFGKVISSIPLGYGFLRILAPHRNQTMHDELGKAYVIEKSKNI